MSALTRHLFTQLKRHEIIFSEEQLEKLLAYIELLQQWNRVYNLIGNADGKHIVDRHIIDSLLAMPYIQGKKIIDIGTGPGLPGIPLAIMMPENDFTLLDSNGKKTRFITQAKIQLKLSNVEVIQSRTEEYQPENLFDTIISRAFAEINKMLEYTQHLCKPTGIFIALKGDEAEKEIEKLPDAFICEHIERLPFADQTILRKIVLMRFK